MPAAPNFQRVSAKDWMFGQTVDPKRKQQLLFGLGFQQIVDALRQTRAGIDLRRSILKQDHGYSRLVATITCSSAAIDLFHNSAAGYRAQYYAAPALGEHANRYAIGQLSPLVASALAVQSRRGWVSAWALASIVDANAKLWIHQGRWIRSPTIELRQLLVKRWSMTEDMDERQRKLARYAQLVPWMENRIVLIGGFVSRDGQPFGTLKASRAQELHERGFT